MTDNDALYADAIQLPRTPRRERMIDVIVRNERLSMLCLDCGETTGDVGTHAVSFCVSVNA